MNRPSHYHRALGFLIASIIIVAIGISFDPYHPVSGSNYSPTISSDVNSNESIVIIYFKSMGELAFLANRVDILEVNHNQKYVVALISDPQLRVLAQLGYKIEIDAVETALLNQPLIPLPGQVSGIPGFPCYRTVEETFASLNNLQVNYPNLVSLVDYGDSWDKLTPGGPDGYDLWALKITNQAIQGPKPKFFLMAEIHARELTTAETATRYAEYLVTQYGVNPDITWLIDYYEIHIAPMTNPDGRKFAETGEWWRKNTDNNDGCTLFPDYGTDLNRNHSFHWNSGGSSDYPCDEIYHGPAAASEPEVASVQDYVLGLFPDQRGPGDDDPAPLDSTGLFISLHSYSRLVLWPYGFRYPAAPNHTQLQTLGRKFAYFNSYTPQQAVGLYPTSGTSDDWAYGTLGIAAYTFELGNNFFESCSYFETTLYPTNLQALLYALKASRRPYMNPAGPEVLNVNSPSAVVQGSYATIAATANDTRYSSGEPVQNVAAARFSTNTPSWQPGATTIPMTASDGVFNSPIENIQGLINTSGLALGIQRIFIEGQDSVGNWGVPSVTDVCVASSVHGIALSANNTSTQVEPGSSINYLLEVDNLGLTGDNFTISLSGNNWPSTAPAHTGLLPVCEGSTVEVIVNVPENTPGRTSDNLNVTLTSQVDPTQSASITLTTEARPSFGVAISPETALGSGDPGSVVTYTLQIYNTGNLTDTFRLELLDNLWYAAAPTLIGPVARGAITETKVIVTVPPMAYWNAQDTLRVTLSSLEAGPGSLPLASSILTTKANRKVDLTAAISPQHGLGFPGFPVSYEISITNLGNASDTFHFSVLNADWQTSLSASDLTIPPDGQGIITLEVMIPAGATPGEGDQAEIFVTSLTDETKSIKLLITTWVGWNIYLPLLD